MKYLLEIRLQLLKAIGEFIVTGLHIFILVLAMYIGYTEGFNALGERLWCGPTACEER